MGIKIITYKGVMITRAFDYYLPGELLKYHKLSYRVGDAYFHETFQDGWVDIDDYDNVNQKSVIKICVFNNYSGPKFKLVDFDYESVWSTGSCEGPETNLKIFLDKKYANRVDRSMTELGFELTYAASDRRVYKFISHTVLNSII